MQPTVLFCFCAVLATVSGASVYGSASIDPNAIGAQAGATFPRIPGLNYPLFGFSLLPPAEGTGPNGPRGPRGPRGPGGLPGLNNSASLPSIPSISSLVPQLANVTNATSISFPNITGLPSLDSLPNIPGLSQAIQLARNRVATALGIGNDFVDGIQTALQEAFESNDPTAAVRTLVNTILEAYLAVARNCPVVVIGVRVLQEGIRLASEVAQSARNIIIGK